MTPDTIEKRVPEVICGRHELVNSALDEDIPMIELERLYEVSRYFLKTGGKRLRPTASLLTAESLAGVEPMPEDYRAFPTFAGNPIDVMVAAVSIEVIQSFTLVHDDIMDDDNLRCGVPAVCRECGNPTATFAGDALYARMSEFLTKTGANPADGFEAVRRLTTTCTRIYEGQVLDIEFERRAEVLPDEYPRMVELKTAVSCGTVTAALAVVTGADGKVVEALYQYGITSGSAFQTQDNMLDLTVPFNQLGKQRGSDPVENKETIISFHARQRDTDVDGLVDTETTEELIEDVIEAAVAELNEAGSIDYTREMAGDLTEQAKPRLDVLPDNKARDLPCDIVDYLTIRSY